MVCFCSVLLVISYLLSEPAESEQSMALYTSEFMLPLLSAGTTSINTSFPVPLAALHAHTITLPPTCLRDNVYASDHERFLSVNLGFICLKIFKLNLAFLFLNVTSSLRYVVNAPYFIHEGVSCS